METVNFKVSSEMGVIVQVKLGYYFQKHEDLGVDADEIAALIPFSGHTITHFTVRQEQGIPGTQPIVDQYPPLYFVRPDAPPSYLITDDREKEMLGH